MPKARPEASRARRVRRHNPLQRRTIEVSKVSAHEIVPVLAKLGTGPDDSAPIETGDKVWALASVATLLAEDDKVRRLLMSHNVVARIVYALESDTNLEVRREASGALRNLCLTNAADIYGEIGNKGGVEAVLGCMRWAAIGLQDHERQLERARAPLLAEREKLLTKPVEQMNRKERRHAAKLAQGRLPAAEAGATAEFGIAHDTLDTHGWGNDAPASLAAMDSAAAQCLVELCESLVTVLACLCEASDKLLLRIVQWDWHAGTLDRAAPHERSAFVGEALTAWLCQAIALGAAAVHPTGPLTSQPEACASLVALATASASALCAITDEDRHGIALGIAGLPSVGGTPSRKKRLTALPTPGDLRLGMERGARRLELLASAVHLVSGDAPPAPRPAMLAVSAGGVLCNINGAVQRTAEALDALGVEPIAVPHVGPLATYVLHELMPRLVHLAQSVDLANVTEDALQVVELSLEILADIMSGLGRGDRNVESLGITSLPVDVDEWDDGDEELMDDGDNEPFDGAASETTGALDHWVFAELLRSPLLTTLLRLATPSEVSETPTAAPRRAVEMRALAAINNLLLRLALFAPPPPSQWPEDEATVERIRLWRTWVGTAYLDGAPATATPAGEVLQRTWVQVFTVAAHWASVPVVANAVESGDEASVDSSGAALDGLGIVSTCLGCLWSLARILEGQLPLVDGDEPAAPVVALMASFHSAQRPAVRVKSIGTLAVLARSQRYMETGASATPPPAYVQVYTMLGDFFLDVAAHVPDAETLAAVLNAIVDTYANEQAPWDSVYRAGSFQTRLVALLPSLSAVARRVDRRADLPLYAAATESVQNMRAFLEYRQSVE